MSNENQPQADAIKEIERLAKSSAGGFDPAFIDAPEHAHGLPKQIPTFIKTGATPEVLNLRPWLEHWRTAPERRKGTAEATTLASFIGLVERHKDADSVLFAKTDWPEPSLTAVVDYHTAKGDARFGQHRILYKFPLTREFRTWIGNNKKPISQFEFAGFVEENIADLSVAMDAEVAQYEPLFRTKFAIPTDLIELSRGLSIHVGSKVKNAFRMQSGEAEITFETEHRDAKGDPVHVPGLFMLSLPVFVDGSEVRIPARLRYRLNGGEILWSYDLYKWETALRDRVALDFGTAAKQTGLPAFEGAPEM